MRRCHPGSALDNAEQAGDGCDVRAVMSLSAMGTIIARPGGWRGRQLDACATVRAVMRPCIAVIGRALDVLHRRREGVEVRRCTARIRPSDAVLTLVNRTASHSGVQLRRRVVHSQRSPPASRVSAMSAHRGARRSRMQRPMHSAGRDTIGIPRSRHRRQSPPVCTPRQASWKARLLIVAFRTVLRVGRVRHRGVSSRQCQRCRRCTARYTEPFYRERRPA